MADVDASNTGRTGVLVMRAWKEDSSETGLRVKITQVLDISRRDETVICAATRHEAEAAVHAWLNAFSGA